METLSDWMQDSAASQEFLRDLMLAWSHHERSHLPCQPPDLVKITGLLKAVGFGMTKVERMEGESWAPGRVNGCTVDIQCPVSKTKLTLSAPEAMCHCQRGSAGMANQNQSEMKMKIAMPPELSPEKAMMVRICLSSLMSIIWPREDEQIRPFPMCEKLVTSVDSVYEIDDSGIDSSSMLSIDSKSEDSIMSCSLSSLSSSPYKSKADILMYTPISSKSSEASSAKGGKKVDQRLLQPTPRIQPKLPSPNSPYWESSTYRGKQYAEMVKQRETKEKKRAK